VTDIFFYREACLCVCANTIRVRQV